MQYILPSLLDVQHASSNVTLQKKSIKNKRKARFIDRATVTLWSHHTQRRRLFAFLKPIYTYCVPIVGDAVHAAPQKHNDKLRHVLTTKMVDGWPLARPRTQDVRKRHRRQCEIQWVTCSVGQPMALAPH